jgi:hypothetical protein
MKTQTASVARAASFFALLAHAAAAPTTVSASAFAGSQTADIYPPSGSKSGLARKSSRGALLTAGSLG